MMTTKEKRRLRDLIKLCLERYEEEDIVELFNKEAREEYVEKQEEIGESDMVNKLIDKGYCIFKPPYSYQADQLKAYAQRYVFPYINEQEVAILY